MLPNIPNYHIWQKSKKSTIGIIQLKSLSLRLVKDTKYAKTTKKLGEWDQGNYSLLLKLAKSLITSNPTIQAIGSWAEVPRLRCLGLGT